VEASEERVNLIGLVNLSTEIDPANSRPNNWNPESRDPQI